MMNFIFGLFIGGAAGYFVCALMIIVKDNAVDNECEEDYL